MRCGHGVTTPGGAGPSALLRGRDRRRLAPRRRRLVAQQLRDADPQLPDRAGGGRQPDAAGTPRSAAARASRARAVAAAPAVAGPEWLVEIKVDAVVVAAADDGVGPRGRPGGAGASRIRPPGSDRPPRDDPEGTPRVLNGGSA